MNLGVFADETWSHLNHQVRAEVDFCKEAPLFTFLGAKHAVAEVSESLSNLYDHKLSLAVLEGVGPQAEPLAIHFSRKGLSVQRGKMASVDELLSWAESLKKETLLVCLEEDHPVTGQVYEHAAVIEKLNERKIFHLVVSYNSYLYRPQKLGPYTVLIQNVSPSRARAIFGERVKFQPYVSQSLDWQHFAPESFLVEKSEALGEDRERILDFEKSQVAGMHSFFNGSEVSRLYDRAVVYWKDIDGEALRQALYRRLSETGTELSNPCGYDNGIETMSLCRWSRVAAQKWLAPSLDEREIRGLMVFGLSALRQKEFAKALTESLAEISSRQNFSAE